MFDAYKVAVKLSLVNGVSAGLAGLAVQFQSLNKHVNTTQSSINALEKKLLEIRRLGLVGGAMAAAGGIGLMMFKGPLEEAKLFQLEVAKFRSLNMGEAVTRDAEKFASGMKTYGTSMRDNLGLLRDAQTILGDFEHAKMVTPILAQMKFANAAMYGEEGGAMNERGFMDMMKVVELRRGLSSPEAFKGQANRIQQVLTATGGRVKANEYLNLIKTGGVAAKALSDDVFYYKMEPLIQEMGGNRIGTGLMSAYNNLVLGRTTVQTAKELNRLGLLDPKHVEYNKIGMIKRILPGGLKDGGLMQSDPTAYLEKVLLPAFAAKGITQEKDVLQELGLIFSNRTASQLFSTMYLQMANIKKNEALNRGAMNIDQLDAEARKTMAGKQVELHAKWRDVLKELGTAVLPIAIKAVEGLTGVIKGAVAFAKEFPTLTKGLTIAFGVLAGLVAVGGVVMLATAGFKALGLALAFNAIGGVGGIAALAGGMATLGKGIVGMAASIMTNPYVLAILAAGGAGYAAGTVLNKGLNWGVEKLTGVKGATVGTALYDFLNPNEGRDLVAPTKGRAAGQQGHIYMDGRKVGEIVSGHQARAAAAPYSGFSGFDPTMTPAPVGLGYGR